MNRDYTTGTTDSAMFFLGKEVEHTPAYGLKTLFVVGLQPIDKIEQVLADSYTQISEPVKHIFFGANHSYDPEKNWDWDAWTQMIVHFLDKDYLCSLDIPIDAVAEFNNEPLCEYNNFIPQIRVPIPYIRLWNYNTMIKLDDRDFNSTNPGVWSISLHSLMDRKYFTDWNQYKGDEILK